MNAKEFRKRYDEAKTWRDAEVLLGCLNEDQKIKLRDALLTVDEHTGLDMRQEFYLGVLRAQTR